MLVYNTGKRFSVRDKNLSYQHFLDFRKCIWQHQNQAHSHFSTKWNSLDRTGCAPKLVVELNLPSVISYCISELQIKDCGICLNSLQVSKPRLEDTSRTEEVSTAKMPLNTNVGTYARKEGRIQKQTERKRYLLEIATN